MAEEDDKFLLIFYERKFHKKELIPWNVAESAVHDQDEIQKWFDLKSMGYIFKEGEAVAHVENLKLKMRIGDFCWTSVMDKDDHGRPVKKELFSGILCHWWEKQINPYEKKSQQS